MEINADAPVVTRDEILIHASIETVWEIQTDVAAWPSWQPDVDEARIDEPLSAGSTFHWSTSGLEITSTVEEIDAPRRVVWGGPAGGIVGVHVWNLTEREDGVLVRTEESWEGEQVHAQTETLQTALDESLRAPYVIFGLSQPSGCYTYGNSADRPNHRHEYSCLGVVVC